MITSLSDCFTCDILEMANIFDDSYFEDNLTERSINVAG